MNKTRLTDSPKFCIGTAHSNEDVKFSPDGTRLAVVSATKILIYDTQHYQEISSFTGAVSLHAERAKSGTQDQSLPSRILWMGRCLLARVLTRPCDYGIRWMSNTKQPSLDMSEVSLL